MGPLVVTRRRQVITWTIIGAFYLAGILCSILAMQPTIDVVTPSPAMVAGELAQQQQQPGAPIKP